MISKEAVTDLSLTVLSLPYERSDFEKEMKVDERFEGMTNAEVAMILQAEAAAHGDQKALDMLQDRVVGKPKMTSETKNLNLTYEDMLDMIALKEEKENE